MAEQTLAEILNDCIERLAAGQNVDDCLRLYPGQAPRLRPMLETGQLVTRMVYPPAEVLLVEDRVWSRVQQAYTAPQPARPIRFPRRGLWIAAVIAAALLVGVIVAARSSSPGDSLYGVRVFIDSIVGGQAPIPTEMPTAPPTETAQPTLLPTETSQPTVMPTEQPVILPTEAPPSTLTSTVTPTLEVTATVSSAEVTSEPTGVIEGPVESINGNVIVIYGIEIQLDPTDPILTVIQVGDMIRVEGNFVEDSMVVVLTQVHVVEVNVESVEISEDGEVWRDSGNCDNPPPDWAPANGWRRRCEGGGNPGNGGNNGNGGGNGMGDDDDD